MKPGLRIWPIAAGALACLIIGAAGFMLWRVSAEVSWSDIVVAVRAQPVGTLGLAAGLTAISFVALASYDVLAARHVAPGRVSTGLAALSGATANAFANTLGFAAVTATAVRLRLYGAAGVGPGDVARITALSAATLILGFTTMLALALVVETASGQSPLHAVAGVALMTALAGLALWLWPGSRRVRLMNFAIALPSGRMALFQMGIGAAEMAAAIGALYVLLPADITPPFAVFSATYVVAVVLGLGSQAPGGLGVFEATMVAVLGGTARPDVLAALVLYRAIYNLAPFAVSVLALVLFEIRRISSRAGSA